MNEMKSPEECVPSCNEESDMKTVPEGFLYFGEGPVKGCIENVRNPDIIIYNGRWHCGPQGELGFTGIAGDIIHALRAGSDIAWENRLFAEGTIEWWLAKLPADLADKALANRKKYPLKYGDKDADSRSRAVFAGFSWNSSPEGHSFWSDARQRLMLEEMQVAATAAEVPCAVPAETPAGMPPVPEGFTLYGKGPLKVQSRKRSPDIIGWTNNSEEWHGDLEGCCDDNYYALRDGSDIAVANGIVTEGCDLVTIDVNNSVIVGKAADFYKLYESILAKFPHFNMVQKLKEALDKAHAQVAKMHAAAVGEVFGPVRGVVEDVEALRLECNLKTAAINDSMMQLEQARMERRNWEETAAQYARNQDYYHGIVTKVGLLFGVRASIADDGSICEGVLAEKVVELVAQTIVALELAYKSE